jgi:hypothetical protein
MASKKFNREQMQRCLGVLEALVQSGLSTQDFAQTQRVTYAQLRAWQSHAPRWRGQLADASYEAPARRRPGTGNGIGFIQAKVGDVKKSVANGALSHKTLTGQTDPWPGVRIDCSQGPRSVVLHWPSEAPVQCAQWLKAYLA